MWSMVFPIWAWPFSCSWPASSWISCEFGGVHCAWLLWVGLPQPVWRSPSPWRWCRRGWYMTRWCWACRGGALAFLDGRRRYGRWRQRSEVPGPRHDRDEERDAAGVLEGHDHADD